MKQFIIGFFYLYLQNIYMKQGFLLRILTADALNYYYEHYSADPTMAIVGALYITYKQRK